MKFIHLSDLHLGKRLLEHSFIEDQKYILDKIIAIIKNENPDGVIIAGDIYDKSVPSAEAVELFDDFLSKLASMDQETFIISGNHDSSERIAFGSSIFAKQKIHISPVYKGEIKPVSLNDADIWLLPYIKPANVRTYLKNDDISSYEEAFKAVINGLNIDENRINILVAHQYVTNNGTDPEKGGSEELTIGGLDNIDAANFEKFDYVALGHIHKKQTIKGKIRYCGTPLKYSFSEVHNRNTVTVIDIDKNGLNINEIELSPLRQLKEIKGLFKDITSEEFKNGQNLDDYYHIILTDELDIFDGAGKLRAHYPNLLRMDYDNSRTRNNTSIKAINDIEEKSSLELFDEFYKQVNGIKMSEEQIRYMEEIINEAKEHSR